MVLRRTLGYKPFNFGFCSGIGINSRKRIDKMNKVYLAVDRDGTEKIFDVFPFRVSEQIWYVNGWDDNYIWLPTGTIRRLIGRDLTWEDEPVELTAEEMATTLGFKDDGFVRIYDVTQCCNYGPIIDENYCPMCGKKIIKSE